METMQHLIRNEKEKKEKEYKRIKKAHEFYIGHKCLIEKFLKGHLIERIAVKTGSEGHKLDLMKMIRCAKMFDGETHLEILEHDNKLLGFYHSELPNIISILTNDIEFNEEDENNLNLIIYLVDYHDLVKNSQINFSKLGEFSHNEFRKLVETLHPESLLADIFKKEYRNRNFLSTGSFRFNKNSFDIKGNLIYFDLSDEKQSKFTFVNGREINDEDYKYILGKLKENEIPPLFTIVEEAVKAYAHDELGSFIIKINERRYKKKNNNQDEQGPMGNNPEGREFMDNNQDEQGPMGNNSEEREFMDNSQEEQGSMNSNQAEQELMGINQFEHESRGKTLVKKPILNNKKYVENRA